LTALADWIRALPQRYGKRTLVALGAIALLGLVVRAYVVVNPVEHPGDDSRAYYALSKALYEEQSFGGPEFEDSSDWSPGAPFLYAAAFYATGGAREGTARIIEALLGVATILVVFALGWRLGGRAHGRWAGLFAAFAVAVYPPFIHTTGELMSEPPAMLTLPAAVLAFLWASDRQAHAVVAGMREQRVGWWVWLVPGVLFGLTAMFRPEYLLVGAAFVVLAGLRLWRAREWRLGLADAAVLLVALVLPILPWTIRNVVVLDRVVPISTGGGKALYVGTYLPADGEYQRVKRILAERYMGPGLSKFTPTDLDAIDPTPLFDEVAREVQQEHPDLTRDEALGRAGKDNFDKYFGEDPWGYLAMTVRKVGRMWSSGVGEAMSSTAGRVVQVLLVLLGLAGFALLALRRRWWDLAVLATPIVLVTAVGAVSLAAPRRNEVLMTLVFPLAGLALSSGLAAISSAREWSPEQASSRPS
jgi:Dolichyl-phosphate-mannose-protein mannosyltransferase